MKQVVSWLQELKQLRLEKDFSDPPDLESYKHGYVDGFNEGVKAQKSCDDTVNRQALIDAHYDYCNNHPEASFYTWSLELMEEAPPVTSKQRTGEWVRTDLTDIIDGKRISWVKWNCSECGVEKKIGWAKDVKFCPNCGAKMNEGSE